MTLFGARRFLETVNQLSVIHNYLNKVVVTAAE